MNKINPSYGLTHRFNCSIREFVAIKCSVFLWHSLMFISEKDYKCQWHILVYCRKGKSGNIQSFICFWFQKHRALQEKIQQYIYIFSLWGGYFRNETWIWAILFCSLWRVFRLINRHIRYKNTRVSNTDTPPKLSRIIARWVLGLPHWATVGSRVSYQHG